MLLFVTYQDRKFVHLVQPEDTVECVLDSAVRRMKGLYSDMEFPSTEVLRMQYQGYDLHDSFMLGQVFENKEHIELVHVGKPASAPIVLNTSKRVMAPSSSPLSSDTSDEGIPLESANTANMAVALTTDQGTSSSGSMFPPQNENPTVLFQRSPKAQVPLQNEEPGSDSESSDSGSESDSSDSDSSSSEHAPTQKGTTAAKPMDTLLPVADKGEESDSSSSVSSSSVSGKSSAEVKQDEEATFKGLPNDSESDSSSDDESASTSETEKRHSNVDFEEFKRMLCANNGSSKSKSSVLLSVANESAPQILPSQRKKSLAEQIDSDSSLSSNSAADSSSDSPSSSLSSSSASQKQTADPDARKKSASGLSALASDVEDESDKENVAPQRKRMNSMSSLSKRLLSTERRDNKKRRV